MGSIMSWEFSSRRITTPATTDDNLFVLMLLLAFCIEKHLKLTTVITSSTERLSCVNYMHPQAFMYLYIVVITCRT